MTLSFQANEAITDMHVKRYETALTVIPGLTRHPCH